MPRPTRRAPHHSRLLKVPRAAQADAVSCGPVCLWMVLQSYGDERSFEAVDAQVRRNPDGGTLGVHLGVAALALGYRARIYSYNPRVFDPTWRRLARPALRRKVLAAARHTRRPRLNATLLAYAEFLGRGGSVRFPELATDLLADLIDAGRPLITGLSSTHLYREVRQIPETNADDDLKGEPVGHFVVLGGYSAGGARFAVTDPSPDAPFGRGGRYRVDADRLLNSILLGVTTYDGVLIEVWPGEPGLRAGAVRA